ncbi:MAG: TonB-dependent receptor [Alteromonadaceae bacterium]|uniref:TonB-dependent receptor n=1 Tax=Paraglaciecola chathamensis TaxID=368405 RepID=UPI000C40FC16|nr:TonB-dependent receptor [Paraglaciecola agarilytica]MBN23899.1 TonB-dependent receptor [Alteromonadaceae bacterium]
MGPTAHTHTFSRKLTLLGAAVSLALAGNVSAQTAETEQASSDDFENITVTARKRTESLFESPTAITSLSDSFMDDANISNLDDVGKYVPNLNVSRYGAGNSAHASIFIRGIGLQDHIITTDPGVGVYVDGVYLGRQMGANLSLPNIASVEVLRGPQGTLYGRNTLGGAVNIITKKPGDESMASVAAKVGTLGRVAADLYINGDINDDVSIAASGSFKKRDGVGEAVNLANPEKEIGEEQEFSGRLSANWRVSNNFSLLFAVDGYDNESGQSPYTIEFTDPSPDPTDIFNGDFPLLTPDLIPADPDDLGTTVPGLESTASAGWGASITANWDINENYATKLITSFRSSDYEGGLDDDASPLNLSEFPETGEADQYSVELQVNGTFDNYDFVSGVYFFNEEGSTESGPWVFSPFNTPGALNNDGTPTGFGGDYGFFDLHQETDAFAIYANASYDLSEKLTVGGGLRYSKDKKDADALFPSFAERAYRSAEFSEVTWDVNAAYQLDNGLNVYAQVQKGYQTGGFPPRPFGGAAQFVQFDETTSINYETGLKGKIAENVSLLAAVFITKYDDLALPFSDPTAGGGFVTITENAGKSEAKGIELEATIDVTDNFSLRAAVGFLDAEITQVDENVNGVGVGDSPALTPEWTLMIAPSYYVDLDSGATLAFKADYSFRDEMQGQSVYNPNETIDSRSILGFDVNYTSVNGDWSLSLYGENVTDEIYDQGRLQQNGFVGIVRSNDRREFGLRFKKEFEM